MTHWISWGLNADSKLYVYFPVQETAPLKQWRIILTGYKVPVEVPTIHGEERVLDEKQFISVPLAILSVRLYLFYNWIKS